MKRSLRVLAAVALIGALGLSATACNSEHKPSKYEQTFGGEHSLRKMSQRTDSRSSFGGGYFLFFGGFGGSSKTEVKVQFAWQMNDGAYAISTLPLTKVRVRLDNNANVPTMKFRWEENWFLSDLQETIDDNIVYAVVTVREADWPIDIQLPLNK